MEVYCKGIARIRHASSREIFEVGAEDLDWDAVGGDERQMGPEIHYEAVIDHPELGDLTWGLWEYPVGIENYHNTDIGRNELVEDFDYGLEHGESNRTIGSTIRHRPTHIGFSWTPITTRVICSPIMVDITATIS
ncbi:MULTISPECIES: hypothetical protein [unclassified Mesorhizobium]|uniref:hypothetical protein n=1 Tax=unclassified Mesorhizobium TaxID=325217 RepID=UPI000FD49683|nr:MULTISPECIES: hypothetical protein [unclassified Mesorhizobium]RUX05403.1 hypothetical protein EOA35_07870 [Mesorhizobium sp. M8A.F.Ca.ET.023.01.1.1]